MLLVELLRFLVALERVKLQAVWTMPLRDIQKSDAYPCTLRVGTDVDLIKVALSKGDEAKHGASLTLYRHLNGMSFRELFSQKR